MDYGGKDSFNDSPENNINLGNWAQEQRDSDDAKNLGNKVIFSGEATPVSQAQTPLVETTEPGVDFVTQLTPENNGASEHPESVPINSGKDVQPITGDYDDKVAAEILNAENELSGTGEIDNFYEKVRGGWPG